MNRIHIIDLETTGLRSEYHEIIEIALITIDQEGKELNRWHKKIRPLNIDRADPVALQINGYDHADWLHAPTFETVAEELYSLLEGGILLGHNVKFDLEFLNEAFFLCELPPLHHRQIDSQTLAYEHLYPLGLKSLSMDKIREFLGLSMRGSHTALKDALDVLYLWRLLSRASMLTRFKIWLSAKIRGAVQ